LLGTKKCQHGWQAARRGSAKFSAAQRHVRTRPRRRVIERYQAKWHKVGKCRKRYKKTWIDLTSQKHLPRGR